MKLIIGALAVAMLVGCATSPVPINSAEPVSPDEVYGFQDKHGADSGTITVIRDSGFTGSGCDVVFYIEGQRAAKIGPGQKASFYVPPGVVNIGSGLADSGLCSGAAIKTISANIKSNSESMFRLSGDMQGFYLAPYVNYGGK